MQLLRPLLLTSLPFLLSLAAAEEDTTIYTTITTTVEVYSTSWTVVTMTRDIPLGGNNQRPILVESQAPSSTANYTGPSNPEPTNAAVGTSASIKLAAIAGAAAVVAGLW